MPTRGEEFWGVFTQCMATGIAWGAWGWQTASFFLFASSWLSWHFRVYIRRRS